MFILINLKFILLKFCLAFCLRTNYSLLNYYTAVIDWKSSNNVNHFHNIWIIHINLDTQVFCTWLISYAIFMTEVMISLRNDFATYKHIILLEKRYSKVTSNNKISTEHCPVSINRYTAFPVCGTTFQLTCTNFRWTLKLWNLIKVGSVNE